MKIKTRLRNHLLCQDDLCQINKLLKDPVVVSEARMQNQGICCCWRGHRIVRPLWTVFSGGRRLAAQAWGPDSEKAVTPMVGGGGDDGWFQGIAGPASLASTVCSKHSEKLSQNMVEDSSRPLHANFWSLHGTHRSAYTRPHPWSEGFWKKWSNAMCLSSTVVHMSV